MMQSNVFSLDRTTAESEEIGKATADSASVESNTAEEKATVIKGEETDIQHDASTDPESEAIVTKKKKIAKIASVSGLGLFVVIAGASLLFSNPESTLGVWQTVATGTTSFFSGDDSSKSEMFDSGPNGDSAPQTMPVPQQAPALGSISQDVLLKGLEEVAFAGNLSKEQLLNVVIEKIQMEKLIAGEAPLTQEEITLASVHAAARLNINDVFAMEYAEHKGLEVAKQQEVIVALKADKNSTDREKIKAIVSYSRGLEADFNETELRNSARNAALQLGINVKEAEKVADLQVAELEAYASTLSTVKDSKSDDTEKLYQVANGVRNAHSAISIQQLDPKASANIKPSDLALTKEEATKYINMSAKEIGANEMSVKLATARVTAELVAEAKGESRNNQIIAGKTASALIEADTKELTGYDAAIYVVDAVGEPGALVMASSALNLSPATQSIVKAQLGTRDGLKTSPIQVSPNETVAYIAASVASAAKDHSLSVIEQEIVAVQAVEIEAKRNNLSDVEKSIEKERVKAIVRARAAGLTELEVLAASESAAAIAKQKQNNLTQSQLKVIGDQAAQNVIFAAGLDAEVESEMIQRTLAVTNLVSVTDDKAVSDVSTVLEKARREADQQGMTALDREAYVAKSLTEYKAEELGLSPEETQVAVVQAQAGARAKAMGMSEARQADISNRAALVKMESLGLNVVEQNKMMASIKSIAVDRSAEDALNSSLSSPRSTELSTTESNDVLKNLEKQMAGFSVKLAEYESVANQAVNENAILKNMIHQLQASVSSNAIELKTIKDKSQSDNAKRTANAGWLSNRLCENEAATGNFSNPEICKAVYAKYQKHLAAPAEPVAATYRPQNQNPTFQYNSSRQFADIPTTAFQNAPVATSRIYGEIPQTVFRDNTSNSHISEDACSSKSKEFGYTVISDNHAVITNQWGNAQRVVHDSFIPGLGTVLEFQAKSNPRFIVFENGIVCRKEAS